MRLQNSLNISRCSGEAWRERETQLTSQPAMERGLLLELAWCGLAGGFRQIHPRQLHLPQGAFTLKDGRGVTHLHSPEDTELQLINSETRE